jgi:hypothetical protein
VIDTLRAAGCVVYLLRDHLPTDANDLAVLQKTQSLQCLLLSVNGDFTDIVKYSPRRYRGIISLQMRNHPEILPLIVDRATAYFAAHPEMNHYAGKLVLFEAHRVRIRT